jgi:hypothetical protein
MKHLGTYLELDAFDSKLFIMCPLTLQIIFAVFLPILSE